MQKILYMELNAFALTVLFLIFLNVHRRTEKYLLEQKLFLALLSSNALILIFDTGMWILDGDSGFLLRELNLFITACYYAMNPVICMLWSFYADYQINRNERRLKKLLVPMLIPVCINAVLAFLSIFKNYMFYIDGNNVYHRGSLFFVMATISYLYLLYTLVFIIIKQDKIQKQTYIPILVFAFPPFIGGILQILFYGVSLIWVCMTISVLIIFINLQNNQLYTDYLTGLFNRRQLDYYLQQAQNSMDKGCLAGLMIDINCFKQINDIHGHSAGDQALKYTAGILEKTFRKNDFIARYGGDEFIVILTLKEYADLKKAVDRLRENVAEFNTQRTVPYGINLSIGYDCYDFQSQVSIRDFLKHIDDLMYQDKLDHDIA